MYERFTDRARTVLLLANQEAQRFSQQSIGTVGTEHILLGILREGPNVAATALKNLGLDWNKLNQEVAKIKQAGEHRDFSRERLPQTPRVKRVIVTAQEEAELLDAPEIGTGHLLLALVHDRESVAAQMLTRIGLKLEDVRNEVLRLLTGEFPPEKASDILPRSCPVPSSAEPDSLVVMEKEAMYERFTDRARKVLQLANQEAQRFNHEYIGTEHILLGLVKEGSGVAANVLKNLDIDLRKIRLEVEKIVQSGPDMVTIGKLPQTPRAKKVIEYSIEEARNLNHNYVGTEHLLLGLIREQEGVSAQVLMNLGLTLDEVRFETLQILGFPLPKERDVRNPPRRKPIRSWPYPADPVVVDTDPLYERFTNSAYKVMHLANKEAARFSHPMVATEHLLLGLLKEGSGVAARVLMNLGLDVLQVRAEVEKIVPCSPAQACRDKLPLAPQTKLVIEYARDEARNLKHDYIGTEHLLLGLLRESEWVAFQIFKNLGLSVQDIRREVLELLGHERTLEQKGDAPIAHLPRPLMNEGDGTTPGEENPAGPPRNDVLLAAERERIRSLEQQLWNVRVVLGALVGMFAGVLLFASMGGIIGLLVGGAVAALGGRFLGTVAGGGAGLLLGSVHLARDGGSLAGALLGALVGFLIAEIGRSSRAQ